MINVSLQHLENVRQKSEIEMRRECDESRWDFSAKSELIIFNQRTLIMSASSETYENFVQIVENLMNFDLIDRTIAKLHLRAILTKTDITTKMNWTSTCEKLREFYVTNVHLKICT